MQEAYPTGGAMSAVLGTDAELIEKICNETQGIVSIANYNCPGQIVITGENARLVPAQRLAARNAVGRPFTFAFTVCDLSETSWI